MRKLVKYLFGFQLMQCRCGRRYLKGTFYHIHVQGLGLILWSDDFIASCQSKIIEIEIYP